MQVVPINRVPPPRPPPPLLPPPLPQHLILKAPKAKAPKEPITVKNVLKVRRKSHIVKKRKPTEAITLAEQGVFPNIFVVCIQSILTLYAVDVVLSKENLNLTGTNTSSATESCDGIDERTSSEGMTNLISFRIFVLEVDLTVNDAILSYTYILYYIVS